MENKDNELELYSELKLYSELDLINAYREGVRDKISFLAVIAAALLAASVVGTVVGKVIPPPF